MKKKFIIFSVFIMIIFCIAFYCKKTSKGKIEEKALSGKERIYASDQVKKEISFYPSGKLENQVPDAITVSLSEKMDVEANTILSYSNSKDCLKTEPEIKGYILWINSGTFEYKIDEILQPETKYEIKITCIPLEGGNKKSIKPIEFNFTTPPFKLLSGYANKWDEQEVEAFFHLNYPLDSSRLGDYVEIYDANNEKVQIKAAEVSPNDEHIAVLKFKNTSNFYKIKFKSGLTIKDKEIGLKKDEYFELKRSTGELAITGISVIEGEDNFILRVFFNVQKGRQCFFNPEKIKSYFIISPYTSIKIISSTANIIDLHGNFEPEKSYSIKILAGLKSLEGYQLKNEFNRLIMIPSLSSKIAFAVQGMYLGKRGGAKLPIKVRKVKEINVSIWRMPGENISLWYSDKRGYRWSFKDLAEPIVSKFIEVNAGEKNKLYWLDLDKIFNTKEEGIYLISISTKKFKNEYEEVEDYGYGYYNGSSSVERDDMILIISDLSIVAKISPKKIHIWTLDAATLQPKKGTKLILKSQKNAVMGSCITNGNGYCIIPYSKERERKPYLLLAKKGSEFSFLYFEQSKLSQSSFEISGIPMPENKYLAYFYSERDLYRPGENIHFAIILRENETYRGLSLPIIAYINDPRGNELFRLQSKTDEFGLTEFNLPTESSFPTGRYTIDFKIEKQSVAEGYFFLEEFVPQRIQVFINTEKEEYILREAIDGSVRADYLFGAPASNQPYELICKLEESTYKPRNFAEYIFGLYRKEKLLEELPMQKGNLDDKGEADFHCPILNLSQYKTPVIVSIAATVFEAASGRASKSQRKVLIHPSDFYIGLKTKSSGIEPGKPSVINGVIINRDQSINFKMNKLKYRIYQITLNYARIYNAAQNRFLWQWTEQQMPYQEISTVEVKDGKFTIQFKPEEYWKDYLVEVFSEDELSKSSILIQGWHYVTEKEKAPSPEILNIKANKEKYDYGDKAIISTLLPFEGKILWSLELNDLLKYEWADAKGETAEYSFSIPKGTSTIYISALLISSNEKYSIRRAYGIKKIKIYPSQHLINFQLKAPDVVKPKSKIKIEIKAPEAFEGTISIVDEGILQITQFKTPKPYEGIFKDIQLDLETAETFGWIIRKDMYEETGGGERISIGEMPSFIKLVSYWSGIIKSNNKGYASVEYSVPQYEGKLRIMFSGMNSKKLGYAEKNTIVRSNVSILATVPRFAHTNDSINIPISFVNNTKEKANINLSLNIKGGNILNKIPENILLDANQHYAIYVPIKIISLTDPVNFSIKAKSEKEYYEEDYMIAVKPDRPYLTESEVIELEADENDLTKIIKNWLPLRLKVEMVISPIMAIGRLKHLTYLIRYPYGCIEQTSSSLLPLLHLQEILDLIDPEIAEKAALKDKIYSGIHRILSMQTISGGFGYWPGSTEASVWSSIYATFVLLQAKEAGFIIPEHSLKAALNFVAFYTHNEPFRYYVLALGNYLKEQDINDLEIFAAKPNLSSEDLLFISAALLEVGKTEKAEKIFQKAIHMNPREGRDLGYNFYSALRDVALRLYFAEKIYPGSVENERLTESLINKLSKRSWYYSTQELAWSILAISQRIRNVQYAKEFNAVLKLNGNEYKGKKNQWGLAYSININKPIENFSIDLEAEGKVYLFISITGFKENAQFNMISNGIKVERRYYDYRGKELYEFNKKDLIIVQLKIDNLSGMELDNLAISDYLPAGFEIENPRLSSENLPKWIKEEDFMKADYIDYRDDRINIFGKLRRGSYYVYYIARATLEGEFFIPPTEAVVMYQPEIRSNTMSELARIR